MRRVPLWAIASVSDVDATVNMPNERTATLNMETFIAAVPPRLGQPRREAQRFAAPWRTRQVLQLVHQQGCSSEIEMCLSVGGDPLLHSCKEPYFAVWMRDRRS